MKRSFIGYLAIIAVMCMAPAYGGGPDKKPAMSAEQKAMMDAWQKAGTPGKEHAMLANMVGKWKVTTKSWHNGPKKEPQTSTGTAEIISVLNGRFFQETLNDQMMGQPFEGRGFMGYDNVQKKYVTTWSDSMSTSIMMMTGTYDDATKTLSYSGSYADPMSGKTKTMKMTCKIVDPNKNFFEFWDEGPDGKFVKMMEMTYTRDTMAM